MRQDEPQASDNDDHAHRHPLIPAKIARKPSRNQGQPQQIDQQLRQDVERRALE